MRVRAQVVYLTAADLCERYHCSRMWITRHIKQHHFPKPITFDGRVGCVRRWSRSEVEQWEDEWLTAALGNELVRSARPHQGAHDHVRGQSAQGAEKVK